MRIKEKLKNARNDKNWLISFMLVDFIRIKKEMKNYGLMFETI